VCRQNAPKAKRNSARAVALRGKKIRQWAATSTLDSRAFFIKKQSVLPAFRQVEKAICYLLYQLGGGSLERRAVKVEIIIAEFHHIDAPTP
jgi:hypothetical protein